MLSSAERTALNSIVRVRVPSSVSIRSCYDARNKISNAFNPMIRREGASMAKEGDPLFMTRATFDHHQLSQRTQCAGADFGVRPTNWQKRFLVLTKLYHSQAEIPEFVGSGTMNRMHDRMRIVLTFAAICGFFVLFFTSHSMNVGKVMRDREAGVAMRS
ncbi:hypothetical protein ANCCAN_17500 [Ancylostoma caninum]|uniref:Uncharacterized protein n=1 Tax=Ancylostoma caninum TaxID=29170 RepID=A0A368FWP0_ANCCA|nr:hypothetical protein ANCCAN_17500 [Ancylostoma caninum]